LDVGAAEAHGCGTAHIAEAQHCNLDRFYLATFVLTAGAWGQQKAEEDGNGDSEKRNT
jgi:hypothetical protein